MKKKNRLKCKCTLLAELWSKCLRPTIAFWSNTTVSQVLHIVLHCKYTYRHIESLIVSLLYEVFSSSRLSNILGHNGWQPEPPSGSSIRSGILWMLAFYTQGLFGQKNLINYLLAAFVCYAGMDWIFQMRNNFSSLHLQKNDRVSFSFEIQINLDVSVS